MAANTSQQLRETFLMDLYRSTNGNQHEFRDAGEMGSALGLTLNEAMSLASHLESLGLVELSCQTRIQIRPAGIEEAERLGRPWWQKAWESWGRSAVVWLITVMVGAAIVKVLDRLFP